MDSMKLQHMKAGSDMAPCRANPDTLPIESTGQPGMSAFAPITNNHSSLHLYTANDRRCPSETPITVWLKEPQSSAVPA